jgi:hypothetical protein
MNYSSVKYLRGIVVFLLLTLAMTTEFKNLGSAMSDLVISH